MIIWAPVVVLLQVAMDMRWIDALLRRFKCCSPDHRYQVVGQEPAWRYDAAMLLP